MHPAPLRLVAQDLQCQAEGCEGQPSGVRRRHGGKDVPRTWLEGTFVETIKGWQSGWFYITEPREPKWAAAPEFKSGVPMQLTYWKEKGLLRGSPEELTGLQSCLQTLVNKKLKLVNVIQVMIVRRILPCQQRASNLWKFDPAQHRTLSGLFDTMYEAAVQGRRSPRIRN